MTVISIPINGFPYPVRPWSNITPFTYQDFENNAIVLTRLRHWLSTDLIEFLNKELTDQSGKWTEEVTKLVAEVDASLAVQADQVNEEVATLKEYVDTEVARILDNSLEVNDPMVALIVKNPASATRVEADKVYQGKGTVDNVAVAEKVTAAGPTKDALDSAYKKLADVTPTAQGGTGRSQFSGVQRILLSGATPTGNVQDIASGAAGLFLSSAGPNNAPVWSTPVDDASPTSLTKTLSAKKISDLIADIPRPSEGTLANRPSAAQLPDGIVYYASDVQESYIVKSKLWKLIGFGGAILGSAKRIPLFQSLSTAYEDVPGLSVAFTVGSRPVSITLSTTLSPQLAGNGAAVKMILDGTRLIAFPFAGNVGATAVVPTHREVMLDDLAPGSTHTVKVQLGTSAANSYAQMGHGADAVGALLVVRSQ